MTAQKQSAMIFIDGSNIFFALKDEGWRIDWARFLVHFNAMYNVKAAFYYNGYPTQGVFFDTNPSASLTDFKEQQEKVKAYHKRLRSIGYTVRSKPVGRVYDRSAGSMVHKCNFDVELAIDAIDKLNEYQVCVMCSGDGDFDKLVRYMKGKHKAVVVVASRNHLSTLLNPNKTILLENLRNAIETSWA